MSVEALAWASQQTAGSPGAKLVLIALANYANEHGECWPSQATLTRWTEQSERTVRAHLAALDSKGLIERQGRTTAMGVYMTDMVRLPVPTIQRQKLPVEPAAEIAGGKSDQRQILPTAKIAAYPKEKEKDLLLLRSTTKTRHREKISFDVETARFIGVNGSEDLWRRAYPGVDVAAEIAKAAAWIVSNPQKAPKSAYARFLNGWLSRAQDRAPRRPSLGNVL